MNLTQKTLLEIMPDANVGVWTEPLTSAAEFYAINTPLRLAAWLAQIAHESAELCRLEESLNYKPMALSAVFGAARFPRELAEELGRTSKHPADQTRIANIAYANRMGNGPIDSGDGWRFRGRSPIQLTGRANYQDAGAALGLPLVDGPDMAIEPDTGAMIAGWFWETRKLNALADLGDFEGIVRKVNGGVNGLADRMAYYETALAVLGAQ